MQLAQCGKRNVQLPVLLAVGGDDMDRRAVVPMGDRDAVVSGYCNGGGDARHHLKGDVVFPQQFQLLAAASE